MGMNTPIVLIAILLISIQGVRAEGEPALIQKAEELYHFQSGPDRLDKIDSLLDQIEKADPSSIYVDWARARQAYARSQDLLTSDKQKFKKEGMELARVCQKHGNECIRKAPKNAECHLAMGVCYALEASVRGSSIKTARLCGDIDRELKNAMNFESDFKHAGKYSTRQVAQIVRGILYRVMPENIWFRFIAGVRGNKKKSYDWIRDGVQGQLAEEPLMVTELGASALCYGESKHKDDFVTEGISILKNGLALPTRSPLDEHDKKNMRILLDKPKQACNYRRERFENIAEKLKKEEPPPKKSS
jgi:hypothetical protein